MYLKYEDVEDAIHIFLELLKEGEIDQKDQGELFLAYQRPDVQFVLDEIIEKSAEVQIFSLAGKIYLTPGVENYYLGYSNEELRKEMKLGDTNSHLYLAYFIILNMLARFYNSDDQTLARRQFITLEEIESSVTRHLEQVMRSDEARVEEVENGLRVNLKSIAQIWSNTPIYSDHLKSLPINGKYRVCMILRVLRFLEKEALVSVLEDFSVVLTDKMKHLITYYYSNSDRKDELLRMLQNSLPID